MAGIAKVGLACLPACPGPGCPAQHCLPVPCLGSKLRIKQRGTGGRHRLLQARSTPPRHAMLVVCRWWV